MTTETEPLYYNRPRKKLIKRCCGCAEPFKDGEKAVRIKYAGGSPSKTKFLLFHEKCEDKVPPTLEDGKLIGGLITPVTIIDD